MQIDYTDPHDVFLHIVAVAIDESGSVDKFRRDLNEVADILFFQGHLRPPVQARVEALLSTFRDVRLPQDDAHSNGQERTWEFLDEPQMTDYQKGPPR